MTSYRCCDHNRRILLRGGAMNGIDWIDVTDLDATSEAERQRVLRVGFVNTPAPAGLSSSNVRITGGGRGYQVEADAVTYDGDVLVVHLTAYGDFSMYVLALVAADGRPLSSLDPQLASLPFSFKVECPTPVDCRTEATCPAPVVATPPIDYLAKDYVGFRDVMLDRIRVTAPSWTERNPADTGIALVELLAYVADHLSYQQDAIATEAYLGTARRRVSVKRHAKLVDYDMHDGQNARAWVVLTVLPAADGRVLHGPAGATFPPEPGTLFLTRVQNDVVVDDEKLAPALAQTPTCFEAMHDLVLFHGLNELSFYTWGDTRCCLSRGGTSATLVANFGPLDLRGRILLFHERVSPTTGLAADADPRHRHAVRVTTMTPPPGAAPVLDPVTGVAVVEITWSDDDALPFPLCVSAITDQAHGSQVLEAVSVAFANVVLADHGRSQPQEVLGIAPGPILRHAPELSADGCRPSVADPLPVRFRPTLGAGPITQQSYDARSAPFDPSGSAASAMNASSNRALPAIALATFGPGAIRTWMPRRDLFESTAMDAHFVVETESDGVSSLRFGDDDYGLRPSAGDSLRAVYRVGNGAAGNIGAMTLAHVVAPRSASRPLPPGIRAIMNPLPASGGRDPESIESVRRAAPSAFLVQERAVTRDDYAAVARRHPNVRATSADVRWTGSFSSIFTTVEARRDAGANAAFDDTMKSFLERYRLVGHDLDVKSPTFVPLRIDMQVCVRSPWFRGDIEREIRKRFGRECLEDGALAFFHRDAHSFGETLYLSPLYALAQAVPGVDAVVISRFERLYQPSGEGLSRWQLSFGRTELPRCDNDPSDPGRGVFNLTLRGGQ